MAAAELESPWASVDDNVRACVLLHLEPCDLAQVALASRALAREAGSDVVWATLFLRRFGTDFWGEDATPHPYHAVPEEQPNEWLQRPAVDVFASFLHDDNRAGVRRRLLAFVSQQSFLGGEDESRTASGWKAAYRRMHAMVSTWQAKSDVGFIIAGHTSFERLSAIADIIKEAAVAGECRVMRIHIQQTCSLRTEYVWEGARDVANYCIVRQPRNWWKDRGQMFRGLHLNNSPWPTRLVIVYAIDCENMDNHDYQEQELHGMLGEGKGQFCQGLCLNLHLINPKSVDNVDRIRQRLKIPLMQQPRRDCEYYAGPVVFYVTTFTMSAQETLNTTNPLKRNNWQGKSE